MKQTHIRTFALLLIGLASACRPAYKQFIGAYRVNNPSVIPDYSRYVYWAALPFKKDLSDSVPQPLWHDYHPDSTVDVFFLHPTTFGGKNSNWNASVNDSELNAKTDYSSILYQASTFNEYRVFAPRYRQANIKAYYTTDTADAVAAFDTAYQDIRSAFQYYLDHYNQGRPIIIASHSQGTTHAKRLLKEFFDGKKLQQKLVAAYIPGIAVPKAYYSSLTACTDSNMTGCIVSWRTYKKGYTPPFIQKEDSPAIVVNPLSWTTSDVYAPKGLNEGALLKDFNELHPGLTDAQINGNLLWIHKPHFKGSFLYFSKNYHIGDINLFYMNIRENLRTRVGSYRKKALAGS